MEGEQSEHEEETGRLQLFDHPFNKDLTISEVYEIPFRELWMRDGMQTFDPADPARDRLRPAVGEPVFVVFNPPLRARGAGRGSSSPSSKPWRVRACRSSTR